ncbi:MAG: glycosyltransferase family 2 protein [Acidobacteria bacterium]|nr:glycosyltransferase family 2 protein [Acidobacteriota bacterium]
MVVPLYNKEDTILRTLKSVQGQTFTDFEVIVVDDGSTDDGAAVASCVADPRFRILRQRNQGPGAARNRGIREARASIVALLDGDDEWAPQFLEAVMSLAAQFPSAGLFATGYRRIWTKGAVEETTLRTEVLANGCLVDHYFRHSLDGNFVTSSSVAVRSSVFDHVGYFLEGEPIGEDREMWARIALEYPLAYDTRILATYHSSPGAGAHQSLGSEPPFPPVIRELRKALSSATVPEQLQSDIEHYHDYLLMGYADTLLYKRNGRGLRHLLRSERFRTAEGRQSARWYCLAVSVVPIWLVAVVRLRLLKRLVNILKSRTRVQSPHAAIIDFVKRKTAHGRH